ncbi:MAG: hypothetical protein V3V08_11050 [Nannocystaceae bacterium]
MPYRRYTRVPASPYRDPLEIIWTRAAEELGFEISRRSDVYAWYDGAGRIMLTTPDDMDPDDHMGQLILHELCHALVAGPKKAVLPDWGLPTMDDGDHLEEHAANRLQAALAQRVGLRSFFATTTVFRRYYDRLPADPLAPSDDPAAQVARQAAERGGAPPWRDVLERALQATAALRHILAAFTGPRSNLWHDAQAGDRGPTCLGTGRRPTR